MTVKRLSIALAASALVGLGGLAIAQSGDGGNIDLGDGDQAAAPVLADVDTAQKLFAWGVANDSAIAVAAAAEMMAAITLTEIDREVEQTAIAGAETGDEDGAGIAAIDASAMLAKARELAAGDAELLAMIEDIAQAGTRGRMGGASRTQSRLPAGYQDSWRIPYYGGRLAELAIVGDGDAVLHLLITDDQGNRICSDNTRSDQMYCTWTPLRDGHFVVTVKNAGGLRNTYYILTN